jgi:carotenoid cleavage dioxygenase
MTCVKLTLGVVVLVALGVPLVLLHGGPNLLREVNRFLDKFQDAKGQLADHFYLSGNYAPVNQEKVHVPVRVVEGQLPRDLSGLFVRNGPNPIPGQITKRYHWFDGHGMLHNLRIKDGAAFYTNMYIPTPKYELEKKAGEQIFDTIASLTGFTGLIKALFFSWAMPRAHGLSALEVGAANTNVIMYQNKFYCLFEASLPFEVRLTDRGEVFGIGYETLGGALNFPVSAHPKKDDVTGDLLFHGYTAQPDLQKRDGAIKMGEVSGETGTLLFYRGMRLAPPATDKDVPFAHDMTFTENWIIAVDSSVHFDPAAIFTPDSDFFTFRENANFSLGLLPRRRNAALGDVQWLEFDSPHVLIHTLNAWEEADGTVVVWAPLGNNFSLTVDRKSNGNVFHMAELRMHPMTKIVTKEWIDTQNNVEFPRIRDECLGRSLCQYGYAGIMAEGEETGDGMFVGFVIYDLKRKSVHSTVRFPEGEFGGEPVVIPKPRSADTQDPSNKVYIGTFVFNVVDQASYVLLYDGETTSHEPIARVLIPHRVPYGFHGGWVEESELRAHLEYHEKHLMADATVTSAEPTLAADEL